MQDLNRRSALAPGLMAAAATLRPGRVRAQGAEAGYAERQLRERGIVLPPIAPVAGINNVFTVRTGNLIFLSGLGPRRREGGSATGKVGRDVTRSRRSSSSLEPAARPAAGKHRRPSQRSRHQR
jgi:hypothetical protein